MRPFAWADVEEANADGAAIIYALQNSAEPEVDAFDAELGLDACEDAHRTLLIAADATAADAEVDNTAGEPGARPDKNEGGGCVNRMPRVCSPVS